MPDQLYLSYWIRNFTAENMMHHFETLLRKFPYSRLGPGTKLIRIHAIEFAEPPLLEENFTEPPDVETVIELAREFENPDCAFEVECAWDLWQFKQEWKLAPSPVSLMCYGPEFQNEEGDNLRLELGAESLYLPRPDLPGSPRTSQSNIKSLLQLAHELDDTYPLEKRTLWTDSGDFLERLEEALEG